MERRWPDISLLRFSFLTLALTLATWHYVHFSAKILAPFIKHALIWRVSEGSSYSLDAPTTFFFSLLGLPTYCTNITVHVFWLYCWIRSRLRNQQRVTWAGASLLWKCCVFMYTCCFQLILPWMSYIGGLPAFFIVLYNCLAVSSVEFQLYTSFTFHCKSLFFLPTLHEIYVAKVKPAPQDAASLWAVVCSHMLLLFLALHNYSAYISIMQAASKHSFQ